MKSLVFTVAFLTIALAVPAQYSLYRDAVAYYNTGNFSGAVSNISEYLQKNSRDKKLDGEAYYVRGMAYYKSNEFENAAADFHMALSLGRKNTGNLFWLIGKCSSATDNPRNAIEWYSKALPEVTDDKKQAQLLVDRAVAYKRTEKSDLAEADLKKALSLDPDHFLAQEVLADIVSSTNEALSKKITDATTARRVALIIGNGKYASEAGQLKNPVNDAFSLADELKKLGFETTVKVNLTRPQTRDAIRQFHAQLRDNHPENTIALFYYAGHGLQVEGTNYMVPVDAVVREAADVARLCVSLDSPLDAMQFAEVKMSVMILCNGPRFGGLRWGSGQRVVHPGAC
jgi:tetratricopeptide (TPR) repeat protein